MKTEDLRQATADRSRFFVVSMALRPGSQLFLMKLEYTYFKPRTPANDEFQLTVVTWMDTEWYVGSVPIEKKHLCHEVAQSLGMRLADGIPTILDHKGVQHFPCSDGPNVWSLDGKFEGNEQAEMEKILSADRTFMTDDFRTKTEIVKEKPSCITQFLVDAWGYYAYTPIMAVLFGREQCEGVDTVFTPKLSGKDFGLCTIRGNKIVGLYVIPKARNLGIGTKLLEQAVIHCLDSGHKKVYIEAMSEVVYRLVNKLHPSIGNKVEVLPSQTDIDLLNMEQQYLAEKDWWMEKTKNKEIWS